MEIHPINSKGSVQKFDDESEFLKQIDTLLQLGYRFTVTIAKDAVDIIKQLYSLFEKHKIELFITTDSDPTAADYLVNALGGAVVGGAGGAAVGAIGWAVAKKIAERATAFVVPGIGQVIGIASLIGAAVGLVAGLVVTRMGLRVRFSPKNPDYFDVEIIPEEKPKEITC